MQICMVLLCTFFTVDELVLYFPVLHVTFGTMRLRVRKASQLRSATPSARTAKTKRKLSEVEHTLPSEDGKMQKRDTGIFSTIKRFIRGNAVKVRI